MKNKVITFFIIITMLIIIAPYTVFAYGGIDTSITIGSTGAITSSEDITNRIVGTLQTLGTVVSIIALIIIGMRYMFSSLEEKSQMKGVIGYYLTGALLVLATSNILKVVYDIINGL